MFRRAIRALLQRGVIQTVAAYIAAGWGLLQFVSLLADRGRVSGNAVDDVMFGWLALLPVAALVAWYIGGRRLASGRAERELAAGAGAPEVCGPPAGLEETGEGPTRVASPAAVAPGEEREPSPDAAGIAPSPGTAGIAVAPTGPGEAAEAGACEPQPEAAPRSVAVLPFVNLGVRAEDGYLSDGIAEEILGALARVEGLRVASRTSSFAFRAKDVDLQTIGRRLGVQCVLEGSVQRADLRLRVTTRLVNVADGYQLWSARYDKQMEDVFAIEDEIAENVARVLKTVLRVHSKGGAPRVPRTDEVMAYEYYIRGRQFLAATRLKSLRFAKEMFQRAIEVDDEYALAHAALAESVALECMFYPTCGADFGQAERASERAVELAPDLPEAHSAKGAVLFVGKRYDEAEREFQAALRLDARCWDALYLYARMCFQLGRMEDASSLFDRACEVSEDYQAAFFSAQSEEALGRSERARERYGRALGVLEAHMLMNPDDARAATMRAVSLCRVGRADEGLLWAERAVAIDPEDAGIRYNAACLYALAGERDRAITMLRSAIEAGFGNLDWIRNDPDLASLRGNPELEALLQSPVAAGS